MLIDFHCHTKAVKDGELPSRNISSPQYFCDQVKNAGVKMVAITNHNSFDYEQFKKIHSLAGDEIIIFPGVELDVVGMNGENGHVVLFYDDNKVDTFNKEVSKILNNTDADSFKMDVGDFITFANTLKSSIVMAHYHKSDSLDEKTLEYIKENLVDSFRFFFEPSNYRSLGIMVNNSFRVLMGSDVRDWSEYSQQKFASIKIDICSYEMLFRFIKKDAEVIESAFSKVRCDEIPISYSRNNKEKVKFYQDVNIIFGEKGSGKTKVLEEVKKYYDNLNNSVSYYSPQDVRKLMSDKLVVSSDEKKCSSYNIDEMKMELLFLKDWSLPNITKFDDYKDHIRTDGRNKNKNKMLILGITDGEIEYKDSRFETTKKHYELIKTISEKISSIDLKEYLDDSELSSFNNSIELLSDKVLCRYMEDFSNVNGSRLAMHFVKNLKEIADRNTDTKSMPGTTGFASYAKHLFKTIVVVNKILDIEGVSITSEPEFIGDLDNGKKLYRRKTVQGLSSESKSDDGFESITKLRQIRKSLMDIKDNIFNENLEECMSKYKDNISDYEWFSADSLIGVSKYFTLEDGKKYDPSTGEETMIVIDEILSEKSDVYIFDEPEKSLGNGYVNDVIVKRINDLARLRKTLVIATHNANIAIRTLPYQTILKLYDGEYRTYVGNLYSGVLTNYCDGTKKDWHSESIRLLEGGKDAFNERGDIYAQYGN